MEVRVVYSKIQLDATVNFIAEHNQAFLGRHDYIRASILRHISEMAAKFPHMTGVGTMGYMIERGDVEEEGIDDDENFMRIEFSVDPAVGSDGQYLDEDNVERIFQTES